MQGPFRSALIDLHPGSLGTAGAMTGVRQHTFPALSGLSLTRTVLQPGMVRPPEWAANAHTVVACVRGTARMQMTGIGSSASEFILRAGQLGFIPAGAAWAMSNQDAEDAELLASHSSETPQIIPLTATFDALTAAVLGNTFELPATAFDDLPRADDSWVRRCAGQPEDPSAFVTKHPVIWRYDLAGRKPTAQTAAGQIHAVRGQDWPVLTGMSASVTRIQQHGLDTPHWHPRTAELGYVTDGEIRLTVVGPDGPPTRDDVGTGEAFFVPAGFMHCIEALTPSATFMGFYDHSNPSRVGLRGTVSAFSSAMLSAALGVDEDNLPRVVADNACPAIVPRINQPDPVADRFADG